MSVTTPEPLVARIVPEDEQPPAAQPSRWSRWWSSRLTTVLLVVVALGGFAGAHALGRTSSPAPEPVTTPVLDRATY